MMTLAGTTREETLNRHKSFVAGSYGETDIFCLTTGSLLPRLAMRPMRTL